MSKKRLDVSGITNELRGQSVFFPAKTQAPVQQETGAIADRPLPAPQDKLLQDALARKQASNLASKQASTLAVSAELIDLIRKIVKNPAKGEVLYVRLTKEEKTQLGDIAYTYIRQGRKTTDNELGRIAINFLIADFRANGENSILAKVIEALNA